jgi:hypothetical protein
VLGRYVQATLSAHDDTAAAALSCHHPRLQAIRRWQDDLTDSAQRWHLPPSSADITGYTDAATAGRQVTAAADIVVTLTVNDRPQERLARPGTFTLVDQDGWKVCAATLSN